MPSVPDYALPEARPQEMPGNDVRVDATGAFGEANAKVTEAAGQAIGTGINEGMQLYAKARQRAIDADTTNGLTQLQETATRLKHEGDDALFNRRGENAISGAQDYYDAIQGTAQGIQDKLSTDEAKRQFQMRAREMLSADHGQVEQFISGQRRQVHEDTYALSASTSLKAVAMDYNNDIIALQKYQDMAHAAVNLSETDEARTKRLQDAKSLVTATRINAALSPVDLSTGKPRQPDVATAKSVFENFGDTLSADDREKLGKRIAAEQNTIGANLEAQRIVYSSLDKGTRPIEGVIDQKLREVDAARQEEVGRKVEEWRARANRAYAQVEGDRWGRVQDDIRSSRGRLDEISDDFQNMSPEHQALARATRESVLRESRGDQRGAMAQQRVVDDSEIKRFLAIEDPKQLASVDIGKEFSPASEPAKNVMRRYQGAAKAKVDKGETESLEELNTQLKSTSEGLSLDKQQAEDITAKVKLWYLDRETKTGKAPTRPEVAAELSSRLWMNKGGLFGFNKHYRFEVPGEEFGDALPDADQPYLKFLKTLGAAQQASTPAVGPGTQAGGGGRSSAPAKSVSGFRWNKARTMRIPVYSDGTQGPAEAANGE